jgi:hypothetical protein
MMFFAHQFFASNLWAKPDLDADDTWTYVGNPFTGHMGRYKFLMSMVQSKGDSKDVAKAMDKCIEELAKKKALQLKRPADQQGGTVGLLELDRRSKDKRLQPSQSPEKRGKRQGNHHRAWIIVSIFHFL